MVSTTGIVLGDVKVSAILFQSPFNDKHFYVCGREDMDYLEFMNRYFKKNPYHEYKKATPLHLDDHMDKGKFWMIWVADCFDPPIAIVRADNGQDALETFVDELPWSHIDEKDVAEHIKDGYGELIDYGPSGQAYWSENIDMREVKLAGIEVDF